MLSTSSEQEKVEQKIAASVGPYRFSTAAGASVPTAWLTRSFGNASPHTSTYLRACSFRNASSVDTSATNGRSIAGEKLTWVTRLERMNAASRSGEPSIPGGRISSEPNPANQPNNSKTETSNA
jgi:hypothetical protein